MLWWLVATVSSAVLVWFGTGLHPLWPLTWFVPIPVLVIASRVRALPAFGSAFIAWAIGGLNCWSFLRLLGTPLPVRLLADLGPALVFSLAVLLWRWLVLRGAVIRAALAFAAAWVCYEFLMQRVSVHSTWGNLAYSQMDFLPIIQVAALAGIAGVSFLLTFVPAAYAAVLSEKGSPRRRIALVLATGCILLACAGWGAWRVSQPLTAPSIRAGLIASDARANLYPVNPEDVRRTYNTYAAQVKSLVAGGARIVVMPEKLGRINGDAAEIDRILGAAAADGATVFAGLERWTPAAKLNEVRIYGPDGRLHATYEKHHMLPPFESSLLPGTSLTTFSGASGIWGVEICKDMDFPRLSRQYGESGAGLLLVPAWDFDVDGWYHARMAILRGIESGFSIVRVPKQGIMTVTDYRGRILAHSATTAAGLTTLLADVPVHHVNTLYDRWGDWFAWLNAAALAVILAGALFPARPKSTI